MGFKEARTWLLDCLRSKNYGHWPRRDAYEKDWLQFERISDNAIIALILQCTGQHHRSSPHDFDPDVTVHEFTPGRGRDRWYIKVYYDEDLEQAVFMSVHPSGV